MALVIERHRSRLRVERIVDERDRSRHLLADPADDERTPLLHRLAGELLRTRRIADALHRFRAVERRRLGGSLVVRRRRAQDGFRLDEPGEARVLRHERSEFARVARRLLDTFAIEPVRRDERDALALHRAYTDTSLGRDHVLMDVRVRVASERVRPSREEDLGLVRRARLHRGVRERAQLLFAAKDATQRTTPTRTLRKRAGAAPWPVCP